MTNIGVEFVNFFTSFMELQPAAVLGCKRHIHIFYLPLKLQPVSITLDSASAPSAARKEIESGFDGGDSSSRKCKRGYGGACSGVCIWRGLESGGRFCVRTLDRNLVSVP